MTLKLKFIPLLMIFVLLCTWAVFSAEHAHAKGGSLQARVFITQADIPKGLSESALLGFACSHQVKVLREITDVEVAKRKWKANVIVSFTQPIEDVEFSVLFYDVHTGARRLIEDMSTLVSNKRAKTFVQSLTLPRPTFKPERKLELVVTVRRQEVGHALLMLQGEAIERSGQVDFSDEEAAGGSR